MNMLTESRKNLKMKKGDKVEVHNPYPETDVYFGRIAIITEIERSHDNKQMFKLTGIKTRFLKEEIRKV